MLPFRVGDTGQEILDFQNWFTVRFRSYAPKATGVYDADTVRAVCDLQCRLRLPVSGVFDNQTALAGKFNRLDLLPRHLAVVYRGTGGIIGQDYVSRVCQGAPDLVEEVNPSWPATMGGIPVGAAGGISDPSMNNAVSIGLRAGQQVIDQALQVNPRRRIIIGGYSAGAVVAAKLREWLASTHPDAYLCSFSFGDPTRPEGGCYYAGTPTPGSGISSWHYGDIKDWRHCWLAQPGDMYTSIPGGATGKILQDGYDGVTAVAMSDPLTTMKTLVEMMMKMLDDSKLEVPMPGDWAQLINIGGSLMLGSLGGVLAGVIGQADNLTGPAAIAQAATIGLKFIADNPPTRAHITYEFGEVWAGMSYLGLAIQHVRDYAKRASMADAA